VKPQRASPSLPVAISTLLALAAIVTFVLGVVLPRRRASRRAATARARARAALDAPDDLVIVADEAGEIVTINAAAQALLGYEACDVVGKPLRTIVAEDAVAALERALDAALAGETLEAPVNFRTSAGTRLEMLCVCSPLDDGGRVAGVRLFARDVTARRRAEAAAAEFAARIEQLYGVAASGKRSPVEQIREALHLGRRALRMELGMLARFDAGGFAVDESIGEPHVPAAGLHVEFSRELLENVARAGTARAHEELAAELVVSLRTADDERWERAFAVPVELGEELYGALIFGSFERGEHVYSRHDRTFMRLVAALVGTAIERARKEERLDALAYHDALTGLPNRALLRDRVDQAAALAKRSGSGFAVHFLDLDALQPVNDEYGRGEGDQVLRAVAQRLASAMREIDTVARLGGDEFVIVQGGIQTPEDAADMARRILELMRDPLLTAERSHRLGISIGVALYPQDGTASSALLASADEALYRVKRNGKGSFAFYGARELALNTASEN
jgi:diguanylate cyclase (GGDEF)-like protein/PAS domain S-box-containing protein